MFGFAVLLSLLASVESDVIIKSILTDERRMFFGDLPARFGPSLPSNGLKGYAVSAFPYDACSPVYSPPLHDNFTGPWILLCRRKGCNFDVKVRNAQNAGYSAAIVHNIGSESLEPMNAKNVSDIRIPSVFIGETDGRMMKEYYLYNSGFYVILTDDWPFNINDYLLPFAVVVAVCFIGMLVFMIVKCIKDRRQQRRYRMPSSALKKLQVKKYKKSDSYETCIICLGDYEEGEKLRILPCSHAYHTICIDPWLTRHRRVCPMCKRKVFAHDEHISDSESESEDEQTPLLRPGGYGTQGGTFNVRDNILVSATVNAPPDSTDSSSVESEGAVGYQTPPHEPAADLGSQFSEERTEREWRSHQQNRIEERQRLQRNYVVNGYLDDVSAPTLSVNTSSEDLQSSPHNAGVHVPNHEQLGPVQIAQDAVVVDSQSRENGDDCMTSRPRRADLPV